MEYSLLKSITPQLPYVQPTSPYVHLTSMPAKDYVNPCVGQVSRLYSFYVPLMSSVNPFEISKIDTKIINDQQGKGVSENNLDTIQNDIDETSEVESSNVKVIDDNENTQVEENDKKSLHEISPGILKSFQNPQIKIGKTIWGKTKAPKKTESFKSFKIKKTKHKFNII